MTKDKWFIQTLGQFLRMEKDVNKLTKNLEDKKLSSGPVIAPKHELVMDLGHF